MEDNQTKFSKIDKIYQEFIQDVEMLIKITLTKYGTTSDADSNKELFTNMQKQMNITMTKISKVFNGLITYKYFDEFFEMFEFMRESLDKYKTTDFYCIQLASYFYKAERLTSIYPSKSLKYIETTSIDYLKLLLKRFCADDNYDNEFLLHLLRIIYGDFSHEYYSGIYQLFHNFSLDEYTIEWKNKIWTAIIAESDIEILHLDILNNLITFENKIGGNNIEHLSKKAIELESVLTEKCLNADWVILRSKIFFSIGMMYIKWDNTKAIYWFNRALEIREKAFGYNSNEYARTLTLIAIATKDLEKQCSLFEEAYEIRKKVLGVNNSSSINAADNLAGALKKIGKKKEAISLLEQIISTTQLSDYDYIPLYLKLAYLYTETFSEKAIITWEYIRNNVVQGTNEVYIESSVNYADELRKYGYYPKALNILQSTLEILKICENDIKEEYYHICLNDIGLNLIDLYGKDCLEAKEYLNRSSKIRLETHTKDSVYYWRALISNIIYGDDENKDKVFLKLNEMQDYYNVNKDNLKYSYDFIRMQFLLSNALRHKELFLESKRVLYNLLKFDYIDNTAKIWIEYELALTCYSDYDIEKSFEHCQNAINILDNRDIDDYKMRISCNALLSKLYIAKNKTVKCVSILKKTYEYMKNNIHQLSYFNNDENTEVFICELRKISTAFILMADFSVEKIMATEVYDAVLFNKYLLFNYEKLFSMSREKEKESQKIQLEEREEQLKHECLELEIGKETGYLDILRVKQQELCSIKRILENFKQADIKSIEKWSSNLLNKNQLLIEFYSIDANNDFLEINIKDFSEIKRQEIDFENFNAEKRHQILNETSYITKYMIFFARKDMPIVYINVSRVEIDKAIQDCRKAIENNTNETLATQKLYELIFSKYENYLVGIDHIIIAPDAFLFQFPFEILRNKEGNYLSENYNISYVNSGKQLYEISHEPVNFNTPFLIGNPAFTLNLTKNNGSYENIYRSLLTNSKIEPLPYTEIEVSSIADLLNSNYYSLNNASKSNVLNKIENSTVIHIATHGFDLNNELTQLNIKQILLQNSYQSQEHRKSLHLTGMLLSGAEDTINNNSYEADDGILTAYEISKLDLSKSNLIVLSACETGSGYYLQDEGVWGLRRSFELAGARSVLVSLWQVDDLSTSILMTKFYESLLLGNTRINSLKNAQNYVKNLTVQELNEKWITKKNRSISISSNVHLEKASSTIYSGTDKIFLSPKYWSGFVLFGAWE